MKGSQSHMTDTVSIALSMLHEFFPVRAKDLRSALILANKEFKRLDDWREKQAGNFVEILILSAHDLERAEAEKRISMLAWITRNLLELST